MKTFGRVVHVVSAFVKRSCLFHVPMFVGDVCGSAREDRRKQRICIDRSSSRCIGKKFPLRRNSEGSFHKSALEVYPAAVDVQNSRERCCTQLPGRQQLVAAEAGGGSRRCLRRTLWHMRPIAFMAAFLRVKVMSAKCRLQVRAANNGMGVYLGVGRFIPQICEFLLSKSKNK